jgi:uncharacterized membrane protein YeiH
VTAVTLSAVNADLVLVILEAAAVIVSAIAGMIVASSKGMDVVGAYALACVNAFGGGTVRDLLLDNRPFYWMQHWWLLAAILAICVPFVYSARIFRLASAVHRRSVKMDAIGLALFSIAGTGVALAKGTPLIVAPLMGVVTGTMGGVLRDVVVNEIPDLFRPGGLYATASFTGSLAFIAGLQHGLTYGWASILGIAVVAALRLLSLRLGLAVPAPHWAAKAEAGED